jgi:predicted amidohydrolase
MPGLATDRAFSGDPRIDKLALLRYSDAHLCAGFQRKSEEGGRLKVKVGLGQLLVEGGEPERNLERAEKMAGEAAAKGCQILLLPECLDLGWCHPTAKVESLPIPGPYSDRICALALKHKMYVCAGLTERDGDRVYNTALFVDPEGKILVKYRKINELTVVHDIYSIGQTLGVVETPFGIIGINICADNYGDSLEIGHVLGRMGAQLILSPSAWTVDYGAIEVGNPYGEKWLKPAHTLAALYDMVICSATSVGTIVGGAYEGKKMVGCSLAVGKDGLIVQGRYQEFAAELVVADIEIPAPHAKGTAVGEMLKAKGYYK